MESFFNKIFIFIKRKTPAQAFSCKHYEIFKNKFFYGTPPVHYTFPKFYVMVEFFGCLWIQKRDFSYFLYHCFIHFHNSVALFIPKFLVSVPLVHITISAPALF